jgi:uncharacterized repeat protein (TIGR01451 family)
MMVDPTDGCTFWYTTEYIQSTGFANWQTRVASFKFPSCNPADVSVSETTPSPVLAGGELDWHITATNNGPDAADNVVVKDTLPSGDTPFAVATPPNCSIAAQLVTCQLGTLQPGVSVPITIRTLVAPEYDVPTSGPGSVTNTVTISADQFDPNQANNSASAAAVVNEQADLAVAKTCDASVLAGQAGTCTIYVDNHGPSVARNAVLTDTATSNGSFSMTSATSSQGSCGALPPANQTSASITCQLGNIGPSTPSGPGRATLTVTYTAAEGQTISDKATATADTPDPDSSNNTQTATLPVTSLSDLRITSDTAAPEPVSAGQTLTFSVTVQNAGPSAARTVVLSDLLPAGVTVSSITLPGGAACNAGIPGDPMHPATCGMDVLAAGASATMTIVTVVSPSVIGSLHSDASASSAVLDPNNSNNYAHTDTTVRSTADLSVGLADTPDPVVAGTPLTYTATVTNGGPSTAHGVTLLENLDPNVAFTSASISNTSAGTCAQVVGNPHQVQCQLNDLAPSASLTVYVQVGVLSGAPIGSGTLSTSATVGTTSTDPVPGNNGATATTSVNRVADLATTITAPSHKYTPSTTVTFTATATNNGPSDDANVTLRITLPGTKVGHYVSDTGGAACTTTSTASATTTTCTYAALASGVTKSLNVVYFIQGNQKLQTGSTTVASTTSATTDPTQANNTSSWAVGPK